MENNITVNMENLSKEEREQLMRLIHKSNGFNSKVWKPKCSEEYFRIAGYGEINNFSWINDVTDDTCYGIGNCFKTREDAEFALEKLKVEAELRRFAEENNECEIDWKDEDQVKWCLTYSYSDKDMFIQNARCYKMSTIYFSSAHIAAQAAGDIGEERLKKYYFEVEV